MYLYQDKTARGMGSVDFHDGAENRTLKGDDVMYNPDTGFGKSRGMAIFPLPMALWKLLISRAT